MRVTAIDALIVIDVQNDFVSGTMAIEDAEAVIAPINRLATLFPTVVVATDWHPAGHVSLASSHPGRTHGDVVAASYGPQRVYRDHCMQGTLGAALHPALQLDAAQLILRKGWRREADSLGAFYEDDGVTATGLGEYLKLRGIERVFCAGLARLGCVMQTALGAARDGFTVFMVDDATKGSPGGVAEQDALRRIAEAGIVWTDSLALASG